MKKIFLLLFFCHNAFSDEATELLKSSDQARGGLAEGITWNVRLESWENNKRSDRTFLVKAKAENAVVEALNPAKFKGEIYLFNDRTMWFFKPSLKKPVAISSRQKLSGQAANGDIASTNYVRDYTPTIEKTETIKGQLVKILLLKAKSDQVTYDQIRYWVSTKTKQAIKAEFMTLQGKPFKVAEFEYKNKVKVGGRTIPFVSKMTLVDVKFKDNKSVMTYSNPKPASHSAAIFNVNNLSR